MFLVPKSIYNELFNRTESSVKNKLATINLHQQNNYEINDEGKVSVKNDFTKELQFKNVSPKSAKTSPDEDSTPLDSNLENKLTWTENRAMPDHHVQTERMNEDMSTQVNNPHVSNQQTQTPASDSKSVSTQTIPLSMQSTFTQTNPRSMQNAISQTNPIAIADASAQVREMNTMNTQTEPISFSSNSTQHPTSTSMSTMTDMPSPVTVSTSTNDDSAIIHQPLSLAYNSRNDEMDYNDIQNIVNREVLYNNSPERMRVIRREREKQAEARAILRDKIRMRGRQSNSDNSDDIIMAIPNETLKAIDYTPPIESSSSNSAKNEMPMTEDNIDYNNINYVKGKGSAKSKPKNAWLSFRRHGIRQGSKAVSINPVKRDRKYNVPFKQSSCSSKAKGTSSTSDCGKKKTSKSVKKKANDKRKYPFFKTTYEIRHEPAEKKIQSFKLW